MKNKKFLLIVISINVLLLLFNVFCFVKSTFYPSKNISKQDIDNVNNDFRLQDLTNYLNAGPDKSMMSKEFGLIKIAADSLFELPEYEGCDKADGKILSVSYGIEGIYKVNDNASVKITIIKDNTLNNGNYIYTKVEPSYETSFFKIKNTYLIFETYINGNLDNDKINKNMINVIDFEQKFYNYYSNCFESPGV